MSALTEKLLPEPLERNDALDRLRRSAQKVLMQHGFPHRKTENWKYTPLALLEKREFAAPGAPDAWPDLPPLPECAGYVHLHEGVLDPDRAKLPDGVTLSGLRPEQIDTSTLTGSGPGDAFAWLNLARLEQGWTIRIDGRLDKPLALVSTFTSDFGHAVHPRLRIELAEGARATVLEVQRGEGCGLGNGVLDIALAPGSRLLHVLDRTADETALVQRTEVRVTAGADYRAFVLDGGGRLIRQDLAVHLLDPEASCTLNAALLLAGQALVDYHTAIRHAVGPSTSAEMFRMLADDRSTGVFNGRILIERGADGSDSQMNTGNLLLSDSARINTKPELEIHAEEVSAAHGATVGQLDETALFYLRSRGLTAREATALLKYGFAAAAFDALDDEALGEWLRGALKQRLETA